MMKSLRKGHGLIEVNPDMFEKLREGLKKMWNFPLKGVVGGSKDKDNNVLGLSASLLAGEIASKDTNPLGPDDEVAIFH